MRSTLLSMTWFLTVACCLPNHLPAQDRETRVRNDLSRFVNDQRWIYNDLERAFQQAEQTGKPLLVVFRCIPCDACSEFDKHVIEEQLGLAKLLDEFVCARVVHANGLDLSLFDFDFDQSFHAVLMNAEKSIYGRFGTRSARPEEEDMTVEGLKAALKTALAWHQVYPANREKFTAKRRSTASVDVPENYPSLKGRYQSSLNYQGNVVRSCIHCHQVREAERMAFREQGKVIPDQLLFPHPLPDVIGLRMDPHYPATVATVDPNSPAAKARLAAGDELLELAGQPLLSTADIQFALHHAKDTDRLPMLVRRGDRQATLTLELPEGWRRQSDLSFRATTWDLRRMAIGGLVLKELSGPQRSDRGIGAGKLALRAEHVGQYGEHATAKRAGFQKDDVIVAVDGHDQQMTEGQLIAHLLAKPRGSRLPFDVMRGDKLMKLSFVSQ